MDLSDLRIFTAVVDEGGITRAAERKAIEHFYAAHHYAPLWISDGTLTARAKIVIGRLRHAGTEGLMPSDYPVPPFATLGSPERLAKGDIGLTYSLLTFVRHLATGRIAPRRGAPRPRRQVPHPRARSVATRP